MNKEIEHYNFFNVNSFGNFKYSFLVDTLGRKIKKSTIHTVVGQIDPEFPREGFKFNAENVKKSKLFENVLHQNLILDDIYIKIFVNPYVNKLPNELLQEIKF